MIVSAARRRGVCLGFLALVTGAGCGIEFGGGGSSFDSGLSCGNGIRESDEACDGEDLGGMDCATLGLSGGPLRCASDCTVDLASCTGCGNGVTEGDELCDDGARNSNLTPDACRTDCRPARCGDNIIDTGQDCDGPELNGATCRDHGFDGGALVCSSMCTYDTSGCTLLANCGNDVADAGEQCDGTDLASQTCETQGYPGGTLSCTSECTFDPSACTQLDGGPCTVGADCASGECRTENEAGMPEGFCFRGCGTDSDCASSDYACVLFNQNARVCMERCVSSADCRTGYACFDTAGDANKVCWPHCETFWDCPAVQQCDPYSGRCLSTVPPGEINGITCTGPGECRSGACENPWGGGLEPYCVSYCSVQTNVCPTGDVCSNVYGGTRGDLGLCLDGCVTASDCAEGTADCVANPWGADMVCRINP